MIIRILAATALLAVFTPAHAADAPDPLAPAWAGKVQCYTPDQARRTCQSLALYRRGPGGAIDNEAQVLISPNGPAVMTLHGPVTVRGGAVCGPIRAEDLDRAEVRVGGEMLSENQTAQVRAQMKAAMQAMIGAEVCTHWGPDTGVVDQATATVNGTPHPDMTQSVIWVAPSDGYQVAP